MSSFASSRTTTGFAPSELKIAEITKTLAVEKTVTFTEYGNDFSLSEAFKVDKCYKVSTVQVGEGVVTDANGNVTNVFPIYETTVTEITCP